MTIQEKAIEQLERISEHLSSIGEKEDYTDIAIQALEQQPTDASPWGTKLGTWIERTVIHKDEAKEAIEEWQSARCSVCGKYHTTPYMYYFDEFKFCPNCGSYMGGEADDK